MTTHTARAPRFASLAAAILSVSGLLTGAAATAQDIDSTIDLMDQIIVTGARTPIDRRRIGNATTIITRDEIRRREARYLTDVLRTVPGFALSLSGGVGSQAQVRVRGGEANHVLVLIDGVRANDPATGDEFRWEHLAAANVERIEIVRGPQSALWGSDAVGAVVNVITRTGTDAAGIEGYAETGSNGSRNIGANGGAGFGDWALSGAIDSLETDGTNISRAGSENDGATLGTASFAASFDTAAGLRFGATLRATDAATEFDPVDFVATGLPTDGNLETLSDNLVGNVGASFKTHEDRVTWRLRTEYFDSKHLNLVDNLPDSSTGSDRITIGLQTDIGFDDNELSLALERQDTGFEQRGTIAFGDPNQTQNIETASTVAEYRHLADERLSWILSARHDRYSDFNNALTGKVSAAYQWSDTTRLRASIGTGQKAPTFIDRFGFFPAQFVGNPELKPESSLSYDIGVDQAWNGGGTTLSASLYWQEVDDEIDGFVFDPVGFLFTAENLSGTSDRRGIELSTEWRINDALRFAANYTFTDATESDASGNGSRELRRPRHAGGFSFGYTSTSDRFEILMLADYGGEREDMFFPPFPLAAERVTLADYWLVDVTARFRLNESLSLFARGSNLLDEDYEQVYGYATPGRAAFVGIRADMGRRGSIR